MQVVLYDFRKAHFHHGGLTGYWVRLYLLFDGVSVSSFRHVSEQIENASLARECGVYCYTFDKEILVTESTFPQIFKEIQDYVQNSSLD